MRFAPEDVPSVTGSAGYFEISRLQRMGARLANAEARQKKCDQSGLNPSHLGTLRLVRRIHRWAGDFAIGMSSTTGVHHRQTSRTGGDMDSPNQSENDGGAGFDRRAEWLGVGFGV